MAKEREFLNRRLHSLLGIIPVGVFLLFHFTVNNFAASGASAYDNAAGAAGNLPFRYILEVVVIYLPLIYHAVYGLYIAFTAKNNVSQYGFMRNWMFFLQRITGVITLIFIVWHVWETRVAAAFGASVNFDMMNGILSNPAMLVFYIVGVISTSFHFANGIWAFLVSWGITMTPRSQQISSYVTMAIFVLLSLGFIRTLFAFLDPTLATM